MATLKDLEKLFWDREPHDIAIEISGFTGFRTTLMEELTPAEIDKLYKIHTNGFRQSAVGGQRTASNEKEEKRKWISYILKIATDEGIKEPNDWEKFNQWMLKKSKFKKHLNAHSLEELKILHKQFCQLKKNNEKSAQKPMTKLWFLKGIRNKNLN